MSNEVRTWPPLEDWQIGCWRLRDRLARSAGVDRTDVTGDLELRGDLLQDFGNRLKEHASPELRHSALDLCWEQLPVSRQAGVVRQRSI
jgi:hypothetical protein